MQANTPQKQCRALAQASTDANTNHVHGGAAHGGRHGVCLEVTRKAKISWGGHKTDNKQCAAVNWEFYLILS